jgi:hypothetical protein
MDMAGREIHEWDINWFDMWPNPEHLPASARPKSMPGSVVHGAVLMENGDLIFNFEHLGLIRVDMCGDVIWRLPYRTHHSIHPDEDGSLWVCGERNRGIPHDKFPNYGPTFIEPTILQVSQEGSIIQEVSVMDLLNKNGLDGLLYMGSLDNTSTRVSGDTLHLNDVEPFPCSLEEGFFKKSDIMISLRNINTIIVFDRLDWKVRFVSTGKFVRQHDPDFVSGYTISVFDNNNIAPESHGHQSRIVILSAIDNGCHVYYSGSNTRRFYSDIYGKHQWLPNGNLLISDAAQGRAFEIDEDGEIVWEYFNVVEDGIVGLMTEVQRLPTKYAKPFDVNSAEGCDK